MALPDNDTVDQRYYGTTKANGLAERLLIKARAKIYEDFIACCAPTPDTTILDVGVSDVVNDGANLLERQYPHPHRITAAGLGPGGDFVKAYKVDRYVQIEPGARLPFDDKTFDIATSNAVIEHVGSVANQRAFLAELSRVARQVFISAPNRYFPVEHHTAVPLMHYWRPTFVVACKLTGKSLWLKPEELMLTSLGDLRRLNPSARIGYTGLMMGAFSSNMYMHFTS
jgi:hypothetical protein